MFILLLLLLYYYYIIIIREARDRYDFRWLVAIGDVFFSPQDSQFLVDDLFPVYTVDSVISSHPIVVPVSHPDQISEVFDSISYSKVSYSASYLALYK